MTETTGRSDMATGLGLLLGLVVAFASVATAVAAYSSIVADNGDTMQLASGLAVAVAMLAGCLAIVAIHVYE